MTFPFPSISSSFRTAPNSNVNVPMTAAVLRESSSVLDSDPGSALRLAQQAPSFLAKKSTTLPFPLGVSDDAERWLTCERLFLACLRVGDDESAQQLLDRLTERFGPANERVMGLKGLYQEATAKDARSLEAVLSEYDKILAENPVNVVRFSECHAAAYNAHSC